MSVQHDTYPTEQAFVEDQGLVQDTQTSFYVDQNGQLVGFHRTGAMSANLTAVAHQGQGNLFGKGLYVANTGRALASFSRYHDMRNLIAVTLPCTPDEAMIIEHPYKFRREDFDAEQAGNPDRPPLLVWRPGLGNLVGNVAMRGLGGLSRRQKWGLWIDESKPIHPRAQITNS